MACELLSTCKFFNDRMERMPATAEMMKRAYCLGKMSECARFQVYSSAGRDKVPSDLYPSEKEKVQAIIAA